MNKISSRQSNSRCEQSRYCHSGNCYVQEAESDSSVTENLTDAGSEEDDVQTPEQRKVMEKTYVGWRMENADLFNNAQSSKEDCLRIPSRATDSHDRVTLLNRINEISDRLEKDDFDADSVQEISIRNSVVKDGYGNDTSNLSLREFERIEALYNKVFSSDKPKLPAVSGKSNSNNTMKRRSNYDNDLNAQAGIVNEMHHRTLRNQSPKKFVSFEKNDSEHKTVLNERTTRNYTRDIPSEESTTQFNQAGYKTPNKNKKLQYHPVVEYPLNTYTNGSHKDECDSLVLPVSRYNKPVRTCNGISERDACKTYPLKQRSCKQHRPETVNYDCTQGCHQCHEIPKAYYRNGNKHYTHISNRDLSMDSSSEDYLQGDMHNHIAHKNHKKKKITIDELYKIVKLQNEQITLLQKQIDRLLEQNVSFKNESRSLKMQEEPHTKVKETTEGACTCEHDKLAAQGFTVSVVQENAKIGQQLQHCDRFIDGNNLQKNSTNVSIGVMTSFVEITQKMQSLTTHQHNTGANTVPNCEHKCNNKFVVDPKPYNRQQTRTKEDSKKRVSCSAVPEESITLNEVDLPVVVNEHIPSPECSLHLDIQDYGSTTTTTSSGSLSCSDSEYKSDETAQDGNHSDHEEVGWTLYNNVVEQLNRILQTNGTNQGDNHELPSSEDVRNATIQQLKKLGVSFMENDMVANKQASYDGNHRFGNFGHKDQAHKSPGVNHESEQAAIQHLNEDQILQAAINIMNKRKETGSADCARAPPAPNVRATAVNGNTDLSFATMKYMKRYRLLPGTDDKDDVNTGDNRRRHPSRNQVKSQKHKHSGIRQQKHQRYPQLQYNEPRPQNLLSNKILDITALKQQPKLL